MPPRIGGGATLIRFVVAAVFRNFRALFRLLTGLRSAILSPPLDDWCEIAGDVAYGCGDDCLEKAFEKAFVEHTFFLFVVEMRRAVGFLLPPYPRPVPYLM